ncbi:hypothetical protein CEUSTIGMA_g8709.t1 [Chlamydomonas eustigma]|uniref:AAA+ ATPase domain-containing protein n=1 Tax=Chlamydomonas eustigma TaxID=1157962 RepID=A0A250XDW6_9CHLO|nr:hypothetical protein CEUSTIGMA_g8709.t1 [Chlamydomonas eustigma]|eukprot:GAX81277.1 hypothetical protein CEUSTIGMA_g8709.t1 [Chlamydomonas eustigma]
MLSWSSAIASGFICLILTYVWNGLDTQKFLPDSCEHVESFLFQHVVGQELALQQLVDAVCTHIHKSHPSKPLILSIHGPPGVGKTYSHTLLAKALYNRHPEQVLYCPGMDCRGAKVIYGLDFVQELKESQLGAVRDAIVEHARSVQDPLIVIEEYDKLDCASRGMLRQLFQNPEIANASLNRAIILLESNLGFSELEQMVLRVGKDKITPESAEHTLRDLVFASWRRSACEEYTDTLKLVSMIDFFLPFLPLQREQVETLMVKSIQGWANILWKEKSTQMEWDMDVVAFLADKVDFDGPFPLEGGKQVANIAIRYLARLVRTCPDARASHNNPSNPSESDMTASLIPVEDGLDRCLPSPASLASQLVQSKDDEGDKAPQWSLFVMCGPGGVQESLPVMKLVLLNGGLNIRWRHKKALAEK